MNNATKRLLRSLKAYCLRESEAGKECLSCDYYLDKKCLLASLPRDWNITKIENNTKNE